MIKIHSEKEIQKLLDRVSAPRKELFKMSIDELKEFLYDLKDMVEDIYELSDLIERKITKMEEIIDEKELEEDDYDLWDDEDEDSYEE